MPANLFIIDLLLKEFQSDLFEKYRCPTTGDTECDDERTFVDVASRYLRMLPQGRGPVRGDVIHPNVHHDRGLPAFYWTGERLIEQNYKEDEYGTMPDHFKGGEEFPFNHWKDHCSDVPIDKAYLAKGILTKKNIKRIRSANSAKPEGEYDYVELHVRLPRPFGGRCYWAVVYVQGNDLPPLPDKEEFTLAEMPMLFCFWTFAYCNTDPLESHEISEELSFPEADVHIILQRHHHTVCRDVYNQYMALSEQQVEKLFYDEKPYKHNGLFLLECGTISEHNRYEEAYLVCFYKDVTLLWIVESLMKTIGHLKFSSLNGYDGEGGLVSWRNRSNVYSSIYDGTDMNENQNRNLERQKLGLYLGYIGYLLTTKIDRKEWTNEKHKREFIETELDGFTLPFYSEHEKFFEDHVDEVLELFEDFDPDMKV